MKKTLGALVFIFVFSLYYCEISSYNSNSNQEIHDSVEESIQNCDNNNFNTIHAYVLPNPPAENIVNGSNVVQITGFKTISKQNTALLKAKYSDFISSFLKYYRFSRYLELSFQNTDIIFPFHSYW